MDNGLLKPDLNIFYKTISVLNAQIPISYYLINYSNNILVLNGITYNLIIGNYNTSSIISMILSIIPNTYNLLFSTSTGKFTLSNSTIDFIINSNSTCGIVLGFKNNISYSSISKSLILPYQANLYGIMRIKIKSDTLNTKNFDSNSGVGNVLTTLGVNSGLTGVLYYLNQSNFRNVLLNNTIDNIDIKIVDENDNLLDFNGIDIYITLELDIIKEIEHNKDDLLQLMNSKKENINLINRILSTL